MTFSTNLRCSLFLAAALMIGSVLQSVSADAAETRPILWPSRPLFKISQSSPTLSEKQKLKIRVVQTLTSNKILAVLTSAQREVIQQAAQSNQSPVSVEAALKLTIEQKKKIAAIKAEGQKQTQSILSSK
jgi:hypothetical protein